MDRAKRKRLILTALLVVIVLSIGYLVYTNFLSKPSEDADLGLGEVGFLPEDGGEPGVPSSRTPISSSKLKTDLLEDPRFSDLLIFGDLPLEVGEVGRTNPFVPYEGFEEESSSEEGESEEGGATEEEGGEESEEVIEPE